MNIKKIKNIYYKAYNAKEKFNYYSLLYKNKEILNLLNKNSKFHNIHLNERCFILGNGPSLKEVNFELLADEYVFTVNQITRNPNFVKLNSNYHFWADPIFFKLMKINQKIWNY